jgi:hypothetical protein
VHAIEVKSKRVDLVDGTADAVTGRETEIAFQIENLIEAAEGK